MATWDDVHRIALELPEVEASTSWGRPAFKVRGKTFAGLTVRHEGAIWARCDPDERPLLVASNPELYRLTPHFEGSSGYLLIWLEHAGNDDLRDRLTDGWLLMAPKALAESFEG